MPIRFGEHELTLPTVDNEIEVEQLVLDIIINVTDVPILPDEVDLTQKLILGFKRHLIRHVCMEDTDDGCPDPLNRPVVLISELHRLESIPMGVTRSTHSPAQIV